jgi:hypothetical protein
MMLYMYGSLIKDVVPLLCYGPTIKTVTIPWTILALFYVLLLCSVCQIVPWWIDFSGWCKFLRFYDSLIVEWAESLAAMTCSYPGYFILQTFPLLSKLRAFIVLHSFAQNPTIDCCFSFYSVSPHFLFLLPLIARFFLEPFGSLMLLMHSNYCSEHVDYHLNLLLG